MVPGPRQDWFGAAGLEVLGGQDWVVSSQSNRIGYAWRPRDGAPLGACARANWPLRAPWPCPESRRRAARAVWPTTVTAGTPVIGVVVPEDCHGRQLPPAVGVRFERVTP